MSQRELERSVRRYFEDPASVAGYATLVTEGFSPFERALIRQAFAPGQRILDVGCGAGREAVAMAREGFHVVAMDLALAMVRTASELAAAQRLPLAAMVGNAIALPFRREIFDGVAMLGQVIAHVPSRAMRVAALRSSLEVLRPEGRLALTTHNRRCHPKFQLYFACMNRWRRLARWCGVPTGLGDYDRWTRRDKAGRSVAGQRLFFHMYDLNEAVTDLQDAGFEVLEAKSRAEFEAGHEKPASPRDDYLLGFVAKRPRNPA
jgi:2-polyprenyl-3-methyl-5-hydroxy-6-metoxy-1,4-benzoquinol methylase